MSATTTTYNRPAEAKITNREAWLMTAAENLWGRVIEAGGERPKTCRVSCGWPSKSALKTASSRSRRIGEQWHSAASEDGSREVFVSPALADEVEVMDVLLHELIHAALPADAGHGPAFQHIMRKVGLTGKPTATVAGEELVDELRIIAHEIGRYPHAKLDVEPGTRKPGRMVKGYCPDCGTILYGSRAAWDAATPDCGICHVSYIVDPSPEQAAHWGLKPATDGEPLVNVATTVELKTADGRFTFRSTKTGGQEGQWTVTDHEAVVAAVRQVGDAEVTEYDPRWTIRRNREDAVAFVAALRSGETSWSVVEEAHDEAVYDDEIDLDDEGVWGKPGDWSASDSDLYLDDDEDETPDFADGRFDDPEEEALFQAEADKRDASGERKSRSIVEAGGEGAMD